MADERRTRQGPWILKDEHGWYVGCRYNVTGEYPSSGPTASVTYDDSWLNIVTDDCEGHAMLNIETLPQLRRALAEIAKEIREKKKTKVR